MVSNMFPSEKDQLFGVFVRNFKNEMEQHGVLFSKSAIIRGKSYSKLLKLGTYLKHYWTTLRHFCSKDFDLIYVHYLTHHIPVLLFMLAFKSKPIVVNVHGSDINALLYNSILRFWGGFILKRIDLLVVPTEEFQNKVMHRFPFMVAQKIVISPSGGIDEKLFYPIPNKMNAHPLMLGFISRFVEEKGWGDFLEALAKLKEAQIPFRALMGGKGPDESRIRLKIKELGLDAYVDMRGFIKQGDLSNVYNQLSVYIFPTHRDSLGLTGLEAMSCGIPVIASDIDGGPSTYVVHGKNGYLFAPKNSQELFETIVRFNDLSDEEKNMLSTNALETSQNYQQSTVAKRLINRLSSII